jgi:thiol-disulfide isomerase/thioredoxin
MKIRTGFVSNSSSSSFVMSSKATGIVSLQEVSTNSWRAKYHGNYGVYTIKIKTDGKKIIDFSCSCPSDYYPCKHIPMVENAIKQAITENAKNDKKSEITIEQLLEKATQKELCNFIIRQAKHNSELKNAILLEFANKINKKDFNCYTSLLQSALNKYHFDYEDIGYDDYLEIDELDQWLDKAQEYIELNIPNEAILICKACIEEYASWCGKQEIEIEYLNRNYQEKPFNVLNQAIYMQGVDSKELFDYCKSEMSKPKYENLDMDDGFNELFTNLSAMVGSSDFIAAS